MSREDTIKAAAEGWFDANRKVQTATVKVDDAKQVLDEAYMERTKYHEVLCDTVGKNITRRCVSMQNGQVVIVEHRIDRANTVCVEDLIR